MIYGFAILIATELLQQHHDAATYVWHAPRYDMISANREGIVSLSGYFAFQLIGMGIGRTIYNTLMIEHPSKYN